MAYQRGFASAQIALQADKCIAQTRLAGQLLSKGLRGVFIRPVQEQMRGFYNHRVNNPKAQTSTLHAAALDMAQLQNWGQELGFSQIGVAGVDLHSAEPGLLAWLQAGFHGGMCDAFRESTEWQFMTGGQWVAHPGNAGVRYSVNIIPGSSPIVEGLSDFEVASEQYYLHVDPAVKVLATTPFPIADGPHAGNGPVAMPVVWTKLWGQGRVYYNSLGHQADIVAQPEVLEQIKRGFACAAA